MRDKYNWRILKRQFLTDDSKTVSEFCHNNNINYRNRNHMVGWAKEKYDKEKSVTEQVIAQSTTNEVEKQVEQLKVIDKGIRDVLDKIVKKANALVDKAEYSSDINSLASAMFRVNEVKNKMAEKLDTGDAELDQSIEDIEKAIGIGEENEIS